MLRKLPSSACADSANGNSALFERWKPAALFLTARRLNGELSQIGRHTVAEPRSKNWPRIGQARFSGLCGVRDLRTETLEVAMVEGWRTQ